MGISVQWGFWSHKRRDFTRFHRSSGKWIQRLTAYLRWPNKQPNPLWESSVLKWFTTQEMIKSNLAPLFAGITIQFSSKENWVCMVISHTIWLRCTFQVTSPWGTSKMIVVSNHRYPATPGWPHVYGGGVEENGGITIPWWFHRLVPESWRDGTYYDRRIVPM